MFVLLSVSGFIGDVVAQSCSTPTKSARGRGRKGIRNTVQRRKEDDLHHFVGTGVRRKEIIHICRKKVRVWVQRHMYTSTDTKGRREV
jgi:hypothetical protein